MRGSGCILRIDGGPSDGRRDKPRVGRVLMAAGGDAADVAVTTSFGRAPLVKFEVVAAEVLENDVVADDVAAATRTAGV